MITTVMADDTKIEHADASVKHVISVSGGKDSTATLLLALDRCPRADVIPIFCDTGNEHDQTHEYLNYLEQALDIQIHRLKADFADRFSPRRMFIARDQRTRREYHRVPKIDRLGRPIYLRDKAGDLRMFPTVVVNEDGHLRLEMAPRQKVGWDGVKRVRWSNKAKRRALAVLYPSGNPYLDLCMLKGRFPSRMAQFCTEELKRNMAVEFQLGLIDAGHHVISWQGVRRDESQNRAHAKLMERIGPRLWAFRPLVEWKALDVFRYSATKHIQPNPLYRQGMTRVGCMPCINVNKGDLHEIAIRLRVGKVVPNG
jgi:3'-phosphoadenosine 5'-phosphosulfate sulfotransferase (PAPS reductase)/FAD synthetase